MQALDHQTAAVAQIVARARAYYAGEWRDIAIKPRWHCRGHQFLANARNDTLWKKALTTIKQNGKSLSLGVIQKVLEDLATS